MVSVAVVLVSWPVDCIRRFPVPLMSASLSMLIVLEIVHVLLRLPESHVMASAHVRDKTFATITTAVARVSSALVRRWGWCLSSLRRRQF